MHVAAEGNRPLEKDLIFAVPGFFEPRVLQTKALELRRPDRQVWRVGGGAFRPVNTLSVVEEEARIEAAREPRFYIAVHAERVARLKVQWFFTFCSFLGKSITRPIFVVVEELGSPAEATVRGLTKRGVAEREVYASKMAVSTLVNLHFGRVGIARTQVDAVVVSEVEERGSTPQIRELREITGDEIINALVLRTDLVVHPGR